MVARLTNIEYCIEISSLTATCQHATHTAFKGIYLLCHSIHSGIGKTGIEIAAFLKVEELCHLFARIVLESGTLIDRQLLGLALSGLPSAVNADGVEILFHIFCMFR